MRSLLQLRDEFQTTLPATLQLLEQMVQLDSPSLDKTLVDRFAHFVADRFREIGGAVEWMPQQHQGDHLRVRFSGAAAGGEGKVLLLGHTDTVFPAAEAARRPFRIEGERAFGPGVFDMKSGIALMWCALAALVRGGGPRFPVTVLLTSDEEIGSPSSRALIESEAKGARAVLVLEPSLPGGALKTARKGTGHFTVKAIGRAAHAGVDPQNGINAIEEIAHQTIALQRMGGAGEGAGATVSVGVIQGGTRSNVVPAEATVEVDVRIPSTQEMARIDARIRGLQPYLSGARLEVEGGINRPPMERSAGTARLFEIAKAVGGELGIPIQEGSTGGASDGNFTSALGIPTLDGLGPVGSSPHSPAEYVVVPSLPSRAALIAGLIERV